MRSQHQMPTYVVQRLHMPPTILLWSCVHFHVREMGGLYTKMDKRPMEMQKIMIQLSKQSKSLSKKDFNLQMNFDPYNDFYQKSNKKNTQNLGTNDIYKNLYNNYVCYL